MHSISAMSAECDRVFSRTKLLITDCRARMRDDIMEASECLRDWDNNEFCEYDPLSAHPSREPLDRVG